MRHKFILIDILQLLPDPQIGIKNLSKQKSFLDLNKIVAE